jgi:serine/threonine protein kinase
MTTSVPKRRVAPPRRRGAQLAPGYEVIEHLSRNNALDVYDVWDRNRYCRCVAKTLRPDHLGEERVTARLEQEGRLLASFTHPHIVRAYETIHNPQPIVILETLNGETLAAMIGRRTRRLPTVELSLLGLHVGSAVRYMHRVRVSWSDAMRAGG